MTRRTKKTTKKNKIVREKAIKKAISKIRPGKKETEVEVRILDQARRNGLIEKKEGELAGENEGKIEQLLEQARSQKQENITKGKNEEKKIISAKVKT